MEEIKKNNIENQEVPKETPKEEPKDELRGKFLSTFKIFDDEGPTVPVEITNVGKLDFNIEDLDPNKAPKKEEVKEDLSVDVDISNEIVEAPKQSGSQRFVMESKDKENKAPSVVLTAAQDGVDIILPTAEDSQGFKSSDETKSSHKNENSQKHYKSSKFFSRLFTTIFDQLVIVSITYVYFLFIVKPSMIELPYKHIEGITYFINNDHSSLTSLIIGYFIIVFLYYTVFNVLLKSTPFNYLLGYKIYRNDEPASILILVVRNILMIPLNLLLLFPYLFLIISDNKQTLYDKIFKTYLLKEN